MAKTNLVAKGPTTNSSDDNPEPQSLCSCIGQDLQDPWAALDVATLVKCVDDKDKSVLLVARKGADQFKEERAFH